MDPRTDYGQLPLISPGLIQLFKGFGWAYKRRGLYLGGLISGIKKKRFEISHSSVEYVFNLPAFN